MRKILVVYYSRTGTTKKIAEIIREQLGCDIEEIVSVKKRSGFLGYMLCGKEATKKELAEIRPLVKNVVNYDLVVIGTPIWSWNISSPVRTYLNQNSGKFKNIAVFCTMGGSGDKKSFEEMEKICNIKPVAELGLMTKEVQSGSFSEKLKKFVEDIRNN